MKILFSGIENIPLVPIYGLYNQSVWNSPKQFRRKNIYIKNRDPVGSDFYIDLLIKIKVTNRYE